MTARTTPDDAPVLTDDALGLELMPDGTPEERAQIVAGLDPDQRRGYERLLFVADELNAGRLPAGVIATPDRA